MLMLRYVLHALLYARQQNNNNSHNPQFSTDTPPFAPCLNSE